MSGIMSFLSTLVTIFTFMVFFRIILTWFSWMRGSRLQEILARFTDPYLNWFRRFPLRAGFLDLSPIIALAFLSLVNRLLITLAHHGTISLGIILSMLLQMVWTIISFLLVLLIIIFVLRFIAYLARFNIYSPFWRIVDAIYHPVSYKINHLIFRNRFMPFVNSCILSILIMALVFLTLRFAVFIASAALANLPI